MRLLIVEDETVLAEHTKRLLQLRGFVVDVVDSAEKALGRLRLYHQEYAAILVDLTLGDMHGYELLSLIRSEGMRTPAIVVSGQSDTDAKVRALDCGADDFLVKPFSTDELVARLRAILRRPRIDPKRPTSRTVGDLIVNPEERTVSVGAQSLALTGKEYLIFECIARQPNEIIPVAELRRALWGGEMPIESNVLSAHIKNLRRKLEPHRARVETVRGIGYRLII